MIKAILRLLGYKPVLFIKKGTITSTDADRLDKWYNVVMVNNTSDIREI